MSSNGQRGVGLLMASTILAQHETTSPNGQTGCSEERRDFIKAIHTCMIHYSYIQKQRELFCVVVVVVVVIVVVA